MNPYEVSQTSSDTIQSLLDTAQKLRGCSDGGGDVGGAVAAAERLQQRLAQLHQLHSRSWHILRHNNEHAAFVMARLESMDVLCARLVPAMDAARAILHRGKIIAPEKRPSSSMWYVLRRTCFSRGGGGGGGGLAAPLEALCEELGIWLDYQEGILELLSCQAFGAAPRLHASTLEGYQPLSKLTRRIREELSSSSQHSVIIVHGPSGVGKTSLAAYIVANPPQCFADSAVEIRVGKIAGSDRRLKSKLKSLLQELNCQKELLQRAGSSQDCWALLEEVVAESSYLIVLDDVCDKEIVDRIIQLKRHSSKFLITCQDSPVPCVESGSVASIKLGFRDTASVSRGVLRFHSGMPEKNLPAVASKLLRHCSHHPLAVAILGEALRGSWRRAEWNAVANHLEVCSGNHLNWLAGVMSTIELSTVGLKHDTHDLFTSLAAISWDEPVPVECLQALWSALGKKSPFLLHARELVRRCLLNRTPDFLFYDVHDLVVMFLERKRSSAVDALLNLAKPHTRAVAAPWLLHFGSKESKQAAAGALRGILVLDSDDLHASSLASIVDVVKACSSKEEIRRELNAIVGAEIVNLLFRASSPSAYASIAKYIAACFVEADYEEFGRGLVASGLVHKLRTLLSSSGAPGINILVKKDAADVLAKLASAGAGSSSGRDRYVCESLIRENVMGELVLLLDARSGWLHDGVLNAVVKVAGIGDAAMAQLLETDMLDEKLPELLRNRKAVVKSRALAALVALMKIGGARVVERVLGTGILEELEALLNCPCEEVQMSACLVCKEIFSRGSSSPVILEQVLRSKVVEILTGLLGDEVVVLRSRAVGALQTLVQARGSAVADRIVRAAGVESIQKGLEVLPNEDMGVYKSLLRSIVGSRKS
ncbi:uncharacterized protein LOC9637589 [Selaginella moellendorffii]|uniref:uncharacterized protein LOC9637589 n=1 Tax=Selaginella moellendorffii TaxID=88036 RepID=UPI000D1CCF76|nr:uncharacterized protein LOC9637589 [Selaginella moellendorffii]|eukprot:XP_024518031.1 uncharacterized protein LOC9637589 [Selaginella moellendorffii]